MWIIVDENNRVRTDSPQNILGDDSIQVGSIPQLEPRPGKIGYQVYNSETGEVENVYEDIPLPPVPPVPPPSMEEMQMQTLLNTEYLVIISEITNA